MAGLSPAGEDAQGVIPEADRDVSVAARPAPAAGLDGRDWLVVLEIDAYQKAAA